ncbi:MAG: hypothetical protein ABIJ39_10225 [Chloroflexota bacterium]
MPKTFYTEHDIEDLVKRGVLSLILDDDIVLTDLAYEKARRLGLELLRENDKPPAAPVRPYIARAVTPPAAKSPAKTAARETGPATSIAVTPASSPVTGDDLHKRVFEAVVARLGDSVDPKLLDTIIRRVLKSITTS